MHGERNPEMRNSLRLLVPIALLLTGVLGCSLASPETGQRPRPIPVVVVVTARDEDQC